MSYKDRKKTTLLTSSEDILKRIGYLSERVCKKDSELFLQIKKPEDLKKLLRNNTLKASSREIIVLLLREGITSKAFNTVLDAINRKRRERELISLKREQEKYIKFKESIRNV